MEQPPGTPKEIPTLKEILSPKQPTPPARKRLADWGAPAPPPKEQATPNTPRDKTKEDEYRRTFAYLGDIPRDLQELYTYYDESTSRSFTLEDIVRLRGQSQEDRDKAEAMWANRKKVTVGRPDPLKIAPTGVSEDEIRAALNRARINMLAPGDYLRLPPLGRVPDEENGEQTEWRSFIGLFLPGSDKPVVDEFPQFRTEVTTWVRPVWYPRYQAVAYEVEVLDDLAAFASSSALDAREKLLLEDLRRELVEIAATHYSGNGTVNGQIGRLEAVKKVAATVREWGTGVGLVKRHISPPDYPGFKALMDRHFPIRKPAFNLDKPPADLIRENAVLRPNAPVTAVDGRSSAGQIWRARPDTSRTRPEGRRRAEVAPWDFIIADKVIRKLENPRYADYDNIRSDLGWMRLCVQKNKWEVYEREERETKTRNYYETNSCFMVPLQILYKATHQDLPRWDNTPGTEVWNIIGWSPYNGGMDRIMKKMASLPFYVMTYADNVYVIARDEKTKKMRHLSLDLVKGEGNIQMKEVVYENRRSLEMFDVVSDGWKRYGEALAPMMSRDAVALFGPYQIPIDFLISGTIATAYYNQVKSVRYAAAAIDIAKDRRDTELKCDGDKLVGPLALAQEASGCLMKIEAACDFDDIREPKHGVPVRVDLLGMDAVHLGHFGVDAWAPMLNRARLLKAMLFFKREVKKSYPGEQLNVVKLMRFKAFYVLGGWLIPGLNDFLRMKCERLLDYLRKVPELLQDTLEVETNALLEGVGLTGEAVQPAFREALQTMMSRRSVPIPYEAVLFTCGADAANQFRTWVLGQESVRDYAYNFLPLAIVPAELLPKERVTMRDSSLTVVPLQGEVPVPPSSVKLTEFGTAGIPEARVQKPTTVQPRTNPFGGTFDSRLIWDDIPPADQKALIETVAGILIDVFAEEELDPSEIPGLKLFVTPSASDRELGIPLPMVLASQVATVMEVPHQSVLYAFRALKLNDRDFVDRTDPNAPQFGYDLLASDARSLYRKSRWALESVTEAWTKGRHPIPKRVRATVEEK